MPYISTRRLYHIVGRKVAKDFGCAKAKRLFGENHRELAALTSKNAKGRTSASS